MGQTQIIGAAGEQTAENWLENEGFRIIARNWRSGRYELDIVATKADAIHFIEVKTRDAEGLTTPEEAMTSAKQRAMRLAVQAWLAANPTDLEPQMDLIAVENPTEGRPALRYIPHAVVCRW